MRALQTPSRNTSHSDVFLEQDPFQSLNCLNLKPSSHLSSSEDKFPFLPLFISLLAKTADFGGQRCSPRRDMCVVAGAGGLWTWVRPVASLGRCRDGAATMLSKEGQCPCPEGSHQCPRRRFAGHRVIFGPLVGWQQDGTPISSAPFLQAHMRNKRKFFPFMFFDFCALVSTFLWQELVGIYHGWHLAPGLPAVCVLSCLLTGSALPTPGSVQKTSSHPQKLTWVPLAGGRGVTMAAVSVFPLPRWDTAASWVPSSPCYLAGPLGPAL